LFFSITASASCVSVTDSAASLTICCFCSASVLILSIAIGLESLGYIDGCSVLCPVANAEKGLVISKIKAKR
jgi:hypothetical protein